MQAGEKVNLKEIMIEPFELAEECLKINYYGSKRMVEAFIPLLQLSDSPRIVNVSSSMGKLQVQNNTNFHSEYNVGIHIRCSTMLVIGEFDEIQ